MRGARRSGSAPGLGQKPVEIGTTVETSTRDDCADPRCVRDVLQRIRVEQHEVGQPALCDRASVRSAAQEPSRVGRGGLERLQWSQPCLDERSTNASEPEIRDPRMVASWRSPDMTVWPGVRGGVSRRTRATAAPLENRGHRLGCAAAIEGTLADSQSGEGCSHERRKDCSSFRQHRSKDGDFMRAASIENAPAKAG